jgi:hypothetical protein
VCQCEEGIATCIDNPCLSTSCPSNPQAVCQVDVCGDCKAKWIDQGVEVECGDPPSKFVHIILYSMTINLSFIKCPGLKTLREQLRTDGTNIQFQHLKHSDLSSALFTPPTTPVHRGDGARSTTD